MPEAPRLRLATPIVCGAVTLLPVERMVIARGGAGGRRWFMAALEPWALVVRDGDRVRVLGTGGDAASLDELRSGLPDIDAALAPP